jgi:hypothetical protein
MRWAMVNQSNDVNRKKRSGWMSGSTSRACSGRDQTPERLPQGKLQVNRGSRANGD